LKIPSLIFPSLEFHHEDLASTLAPSGTFPFLVILVIFSSRSFYNLALPFVDNPLNCLFSSVLFAIVDCRIFLARTAKAPYSLLPSARG